MVVIFCIDEKNGMLFNNRRQSRDNILIERILEKTKNKNLWITDFSKDIFNFDIKKELIIDNCLIEKMKDTDFCFIENIDINKNINKFNKIILYNWNRHYPADMFCNINLNEWEQVSEENFVGSSHKKITEKIYVRGNDK